MIHRDLCDPKYTKHYSSLRMQFHFVLSRHAAWDGEIPLTIKEMSREVNCDVQSIHKFIKKGCKEGILSVKNNQVYLHKLVSDYEDGYVKHFPFLESEEFRNLSLHAQRFILYLLWYGVHTGRPFKRDLTSLYHSTSDREGVLNLYFRAPIFDVIKEVEPFLHISIIEERDTTRVRVTGLKEPYASQQALSNIGEHKLLDNELKKYGCDECVSENSRIEILKIKDNCLTTLKEWGKEVFQTALDKLLSLHKLFKLDEQGEVGKYFRKLIQEEQKELFLLLNHRKKNLDSILASLDSYWVKAEEKERKDVRGLHNKFRNMLASVKDMLQQIENYIRTSREARAKLEPAINLLPFPDQPFTFYNWLEEEEEKVADT